MPKNNEKTAAGNNRGKTSQRSENIDHSEIIAKQSWKPGNVLAPVPVVLVSCGGNGEFRPNLVTVAWTGNVCSAPPMLSIALRPERHSHKVIGSTGEFVVNLPSRQQARVTDWCGMVSGAKIDKFIETGLTVGPALKVACPIVVECPVNIECRVSRTLQLGSHDLFLAEILAVQVSTHLIDAKGKFRLDRAELLAYGLGHYYPLGPAIDHFGFSIRKKKKVTPLKRRSHR
jgi:flavin reductase (DIM6/NTAB) family NADH-FMN oxidoreductase RutF